MFGNMFPTLERNNPIDESKAFDSIGKNGDVVIIAESEGTSYESNPKLELVTWGDSFTAMRSCRDPNMWSLSYLMLGREDEICDVLSHLTSMEITGAYDLAVDQDILGNYVWTDEVGTLIHYVGRHVLINSTLLRLISISPTYDRAVSGAFLSGIDLTPPTTKESELVDLIKKLDLIDDTVSIDALETALAKRRSILAAQSYIAGN
jgi:hypothetical protein